MGDWNIKHITHNSPIMEKKQVLAFLEDYPWSTQSRLTEPWDGETFGIVTAFYNDQIIGTISYTISARGQGILSQVFVAPDQRGKGLATVLIDQTVRTFRDNGARTVYLAAWSDWIRNMYRRVGFELAGTMGERHAFKLTLNDSGRDENLFRPGQPTVIRPMGAGDQTDITSLFNTKHPWVVKHYELGCYLGSHFEGEFYILRNRPIVGVVPEERKVQPGFQAFVLDGEETALGFGTIIPSTRRHEGHSGTIDLLVHERYFDQFPALLDRLETANELANLATFIEKREDRKRHAIEAAGFTKTADLPDKLRIKDDRFDLEMYTKSYT